MVCVLCAATATGASDSNRLKREGCRYFINGMRSVNGLYGNEQSLFCCSVAHKFLGIFSQRLCAVCRQLRFVGSHLLRSFAKSAFSTLIICDGSIEMFGREIRPISFGEIKFAVCALPEQIIAETEFSSGANEQFRIRQKVRGEFLLQHFFGDFLSAQFSALYLLGYLSSSISDFPSRRIRKCQHHRHA